MFQFIFTFALVLLYESEAVDLGNVGNCTFMEFFCDGMKCITDFIKKLQKDPKGDCSVKYKQWLDCVNVTSKICKDESRSDGATITVIYRPSFQEHGMCLKGALVQPQAKSPICSNSFNGHANDCVRIFHQTFAVDKADPSLCKEQAKAKKCLKGLISSECNLTASAKNYIDLDYTDYNPFCANNRDPDATGNGICYGVKDLNNPRNKGISLNNGNPVSNAVAVSGLRNSVLLTFLLLMLFR